MDCQLAFEIRKAAAKFDDSARDFVDNQYIAEQLELAANIAETLAHIIGGNGVLSSFGAPGDWGYRAPIGKLLYAVYQGEDLPAILAQEKNATRYEWLRNKPLDTVNKGGVFAGLTPENEILNGEDLDIAIDQEIKSLNSKGV